LPRRPIEHEFEVNVTVMLQSSRTMAGTESSVVGMPGTWSTFLSVSDEPLPSCNVMDPIALAVVMEPSATVIRREHSTTFSRLVTLPVMWLVAPESSTMSP